MASEHAEPGKGPDETSLAACNGHEAPEFSLVAGGLSYRLFCAAGVLRPPLNRLPQRVIALVLITWLPLCLLSITSGSSRDALPFFHDIAFHVRFLIALPVLIAAEVLVHSRTGAVVKQFVARGIISPQDLPPLNRAVSSSIRLRDSVALEVSLLLLIYAVDLWLLRGGMLGRIVLGRSTWYAIREGSALTLTPAGYWYGLVSLPVYQFIILRWYLRLCIWLRLLWRIARLNLRLDPTHPDRAGGIDFVGLSAYAFAPVLFAQGALLSGMIAGRILYDGKRLADFKLGAAGVVLFAVSCVLMPAMVLVPRLAEAKRRGLREYGRLASRYTREFHEKWVAGHTPPGEALLGSPDIQSLADIGNSYNIVREMRISPFSLQVVLALIAVTAAPLLPLALTVVPLETIVDQLIRSLL